MPIGSTLGPFRIVGLLGHGGMASVYEAHEPRLERSVALKVLPPEFLHDDTFAHRFEQEARVVARLEHLNIVPIYASGIDDGMPWVSMRLLSGGTLGDLLDGTPMPAARAVQILRGVATALDYAHSRGVIHRDIKPSNILLDDSGNVCVADFGVARLMDRGAKTTTTGTVIGTPQYLAPELALGHNVNQACDLYSLGIVAYEMLTGALPFVASSPIGCLMKHVNDPVPMPDRRIVPSQLFKVLEKALAKDPHERWPTATAFVEALAKSRAPERPSVRWMAATSAALVCVFVAPFLLGPESAPVQLLPARITGPGGRISEFKAALIPNRPSIGVKPPPIDPPRAGSDDEDVDENVTADAPIDPPVPVPTSPEPTVRVDPPVTEPKPVEVAPPPPPPPPPGEVVTEAVITQRVNPIYPQVARVGEIEGNVIVEAECGVDGRVTNIRVIKSAHRVLDQAAIDAVRQYKCQPRLRNGRPEVSRLRIPPIEFRLR